MKDKLMDYLDAFPIGLYWWLFGFVAGAVACNLST